MSVISDIVESAIHHRILPLGTVSSLVIDDANSAVVLLYSLYRTVSCATETGVETECRVDGTIAGSRAEVAALLEVSR
jgi:hypothetical protein